MYNVGLYSYTSSAATVNTTTTLLQSTHKMAPKPKTTAPSPSYPMSQFATGGSSSYTNAVPEEADEAQNPRDASLSDPNTYPHPQQEAPPEYAPPNRHPPGHAPPVGGYGSDQHLVADHPAAPPPAYTKYTTAAQARWARSSRIAKLMCIGVLILIVIAIIAVSAGVTLSRNGNGPNGDNGDGGFGNGNGGGPGGANCGNNSDSGQSCTTNSDCSSGLCGGFAEVCC